MIVGVVLGRLSGQGEIKSMHTSVEHSNELTDRLLRDLTEKDAMVSKLVSKNMAMVRAGYVNTDYTDQPAESWGLNDAEEAKIEAERTRLNGGRVSQS